MKTRLILTVFILAITASAFSVEFTLRPRFFALFPLGDKTVERFDTGFGGDLLFDVNISSLLTNPWGIGYSAGLEGGAGFTPLKTDAADSISFLSGGLGLGVFYYPISRLNLRLDGALGLYQGSLSSGGNSAEGSESSLWWRAGAEAGFRFSPLITLSANVGYRYYNNRFSESTGPAFYSGLYTGLTLQLNFETRSSYRGIDVRLDQDDGIYPLYHSLYRNNPVGSLILTNRESAEIRNVRVSFQAGSYTSSELFCGSVPLLVRGRSTEIPLLADFSRALMDFTADGRIIGEVLVRYTLLGAERTALLSVPVQVHGRNSFLWADPWGLGAFVSPTSADTLEFSKQITGLARGSLRPELNRNMQLGIWLFEGLKAAGLGYGGPLETPYVEYRQSPEKIDDIQYPFQTLAFRTGDLDDLGLLFAAILEAAGISSAYIPLDDEFIVAWPLNISEAQAGNFFKDTEKLLVVNGEIWLPLALSGFNDGFIAAWDKAGERLNRAEASGEGFEFIPSADAWTVYPPAAAPPLRNRNTRPDENAAAAAVERALKSYIDQELAPAIVRLQEQIRGGATPALYNQLGLLQLRAGSHRDAQRTFEQAAGMGSLPAMLNLGNLFLMDDDWNNAESWFNRALDTDPEYEPAKRGLERVRAGRG
ncbi:hypothetical protein TREPR_3169 [Treponema primitia ZAS-2]|uniref:Uncharacterized protein n=1 Tax=Treponema primitia (strain ATCC BAA-887 / DSM 12427 / ZAS-2) TaxID=545694 RepID=F5YLR1_TREPZ|nr:tetratricopeptide repeat protein [Treponema primitia]AEF83973.1 hypothetical protein TREPR_3169 [Treponema primitia ZAS-2]